MVAGSVAVCWQLARVYEGRRRSRERLAEWQRRQRAIERRLFYPDAISWSWPASRELLVHVAAEGGEVLEFPVPEGWDQDAILVTLAEIEAL